MATSRPQTSRSFRGTQILDEGWCIWCKRPVIHPETLNCGHQVCGSITFRKCKDIVDKTRAGFCSSQVCRGRAFLTSKGLLSPRPSTAGADNGFGFQKGNLNKKSYFNWLINYLKNPQCSLGILCNCLFALKHGSRCHRHSIENYVR